MDYIFTEKSLEDVVRHSLQYEEAQEGLGYRFMEEVAETAKAISKAPEGYVNLYKNTRECRTKIFPYKLIYTIEQKIIYIHAVYPCKANPKNKYKSITKKK
jgi:toxin ParE1/3/4